MSQVSEQRRDQIVQTARRIVDEQGPARLTAETITKEIGVSRPLLYHYFDNVDNLLDTVVDMYAAEFGEALSAWEAAQPAETGRRELAASLASLARERLFDSCPLCRDLGDPKGASAHISLVEKCAQETLRHARKGGDGPLAWCLDADDPELALRFALFGLLGALHAEPGSDDGRLAALFVGVWPSLSAPRPEAPSADAAKAPTEPAAAAAEPAAPLMPGPSDQEDGGDEAEDEPAARHGRDSGRRGLFGRLFNGQGRAER